MRYPPESPLLRRHRTPDKHMIIDPYRYSVGGGGGGGDITSNLLRWYKFDEGSGTTALDNGSQGQPGTLVGSPAYTTGIVGAYCLSFSGNYVSIPTTGLPSGSAERTTAIWFQLASNGNQELFGYGQNIAGQRWGMYYNNAGSLNMECAAVGRSFPWTYDTNPHHFAVVLPAGGTSTSDLLMYFDGVLQTTSALPDGSINTAVPGDGATIGALPLGGGGVAAAYGLIDDARIYDRGLNATDIATLYAFR